MKWQLVKIYKGEHRMQLFLKEIFNFLSVELTVLLTAALPIIELRGAIPVGISLGLSPLHAATCGKIQKYGAWGLLVFVAILLPGTGVWSGSLATALLDMRFKWAFPAIFIGNLIAGILRMGLSNRVFKVIGG
jgi:uncharacterized membrane protein